ncbi:SGNH/GDSL hydrolase family protein [Pedobacter nyackensis]|uniref:SGNH/GDSL hydrolase family protein n=1 Tax=Pedobacter nyackensis TaxID=475255 RepID=UPI00292ECD94|nr:SGNH/GDSL hydrolase family protein [Pedobacter nyackensis]
MKFTFKIMICCVMLLSVFTAFGQQRTLAEKAWLSYLDLDGYIKPFWRADTIHDETVQLINDNGVTSAGLLFDAKRILSIRDSFLQKEYVEGKDWTYTNGRIVFNAQSEAPFFFKNELRFKEKKEGLSMEGKEPDTYILFTENGLFQSKQLAVTYVKKSTAKWQGPVPEFSKNVLPNTIAKLKGKNKFKVVFYGNSIEAGANSSGMINKPPYVPSWAEMLSYGLKRTYGDRILYLNKSVGGMLAKWGMENAKERVAVENPDLVIIGFGMNDGTFKIAPKEFIEQIKSIMETVRAENSNCEFIVISTMLANPYAIQNQIQEAYEPEILALKNKGVAVADMTAVHKELLKHKTYQDMTGNNVNHPNDYLARWYAQVLLTMLSKRN